MEHWGAALRARASVTCVVNWLVLECSASYPLASEAVVLTLRSVSEPGAASADCAVLIEALRSSASVTAHTGWVTGERRRTECVLSTRRQVQRRAVGRRDLHLYETLRLSARHHHRNSQIHRRTPGNRQPATQVVRDPATETRLSHGARPPWGSISLISLNIYEGSTIEKADFQTSLFSLS